ncbi:cytochrome bd-I oxidase subunit CydH [Pectobacterium cacticida]
MDTNLKMSLLATVGSLVLIITFSFTAILN